MRSVPFGETPSSQRGLFLPRLVLSELDVAVGAVVLSHVQLGPAKGDARTRPATSYSKIFKIVKLWKTSSKRSRTHSVPLA